MIEKIYKNKYMVTCDNCGEGQEFDSWADVIEFMSEEGWRKKLVGGEWEFYCPECIEEYNSKMKEKEAYKLYFDEAYKYTNFYEERDE